MSSSELFSVLGGAAVIAAWLWLTGPPAPARAPPQQPDRHRDERSSYSSSSGSAATAATAVAERAAPAPALAPAPLSRWRTYAEESDDWPWQQWQLNSDHRTFWKNAETGAAQWERPQKKKNSKATHESGGREPALRQSNHSHYQSSHNQSTHSQSSRNQNSHNQNSHNQNSRNQHSRNQSSSSSSSRASYLNRPPKYTCSWPPPPPVDTAGEWQLAADFTGRKSFGFFLCASPSCRKWWQSAHAYSGAANRQKCQGCQSWCTPTLFWRNDAHTVRDRSAQDELHADDKPHDREGCERCRLGTCDLANRRENGPQR